MGWNLFGSLISFKGTIGMELAASLSGSCGANKLERASLVFKRDSPGLFPTVCHCQRRSQYCLELLFFFSLAL